MPSLNDVIEIARAALRENLCNRVENVSVFSIDLTLGESPPGQRVATIQVRERTKSTPVAMTLILGHQPRPGLNGCAMTSSFEMFVCFAHRGKQYGYWSSQWCEGGQSLPAELVERYHPLAAVSAMTVDATVRRVRALVLWEKLMAASFVHPDDVSLFPKP